MTDFSDTPTAELYRVMGIMQCERMIYARPADVEAKIDARIAEIETEIARRVAIAATETASN
jgi:hypothetical protein